MILCDCSSKKVEEDGCSVAEYVDDRDEKSCVFATEGNRKNTHGYIVGWRNCETQKEDRHNGSRGTCIFRYNIKPPQHEDCQTAENQLASDHADELGF